MCVCVLFINLISQIRNNYSNDCFVVLSDFNVPCIDWKFLEPIVLRKGLMEIQYRAFKFVGKIRDILNNINYLKEIMYN